MEEDVIGRACGRRGENRIGFGSGKLDPRDHVENLNVCGIHSSVICHTTGPQPLPKRFLHLMRSRASSFK
jgi:hypothetical protein